MYDDKWTEVHNSQNIQNDPQAGSQPGMGQAGGQDPQPVRKQYTCFLTGWGSCPPACPIPG